MVIVHVYKMNIFGEIQFDLIYGGIAGADGKPYDNNGRVRTSNFIYCKAGTKVKWSGDYEGYADYYSESNFDSFIELSNAYITELTIPYDCYAIIVARHKDDRIIEDIDDVKNNLSIRGDVYVKNSAFVYDEETETLNINI